MFLESPLDSPINLEVTTRSLGRIVGNIEEDDTSYRLKKNILSKTITKTAIKDNFSINFFDLNNGIIQLIFNVVGKFHQNFVSARYCFQNHTMLTDESYNNNSNKL